MELLCFPKKKGKEIQRGKNENIQTMWLGLEVDVQWV